MVDKMQLERYEELVVIWISLYEWIP